MNGLTIVERSSKCVKDPSPLTSTMVSLSRKFPLSIDREKALRYKVPENLMHKVEQKKTEDMHRHGRILCKKEVIDWWVDKSSLPSPSIIETINVLYKQQKEEVEEYFKINWFDSEIHFGNVVLNRENVATRVPIVNVSRDNRKAVVIQTLMPDLVVHYPMRLRHELVELKSLTNLSALAQISLSTQARLLLTSMDERRRWLPVPTGHLEKHVQMKHAFIQISSEVKPNKLPELGKSMQRDRHLKSLGQVLIHVAKTKKPARHILKQAADSIQVHSITSLLDYLQQEKLEESTEVKWIKTLYNMRTGMDFTNKQGFTTSPLRSSVREVKKNLFRKARFPTSFYIGRETINFKVYGNVWILHKSGSTIDGT